MKSLQLLRKGETPARQSVKNLKMKPTRPPRVSIRRVAWLLAAVALVASLSAWVWSLFWWVTLTRPGSREYSAVYWFLGRGSLFASQNRDARFFGTEDVWKGERLELEWCYRWDLMWHLPVVRLTRWNPAPEEDYDWYIGIPLWVPTLASGVVVSAPLVPWWIRRRRLRHGWCLHCGYDLTGLSGKPCPECGTNNPAMNPGAPSQPAPSSTRAAGG